MLLTFFRCRIAMVVKTRVSIKQVTGLRNFQELKLLICYFDQHTFDTKQDDLYCIDDYKTRTKNMNKHHVRSKIVLLHKITHNHFLTGSLLASGENFLLTVADICQTIELPAWIWLFIFL